MNDEPIIPGPAVPEDYSDRRREKRLAFTQTCLINVTAPVWAMTTQPVSGQTEDVTVNGLRINIPELAASTIQSWSDAVRGDDELKGEIDLQMEDFPALKGQIVWVHTGGGDNGEIACSIGVLFSIMRADIYKRMVELIGSVS